MTSTAVSALAPALKSPAGSRPQLKVLGILALLVVVAVVTTFINPRFVAEGNLENIVRRTALFGILGIGVAFVIITGGIDLSIGSVVGLVGMLLPWMLVTKEWPVGPSVLLLLGVSLLIGLAHGLLITKLGLQPFIVTLCGLLMYRGITRGITSDRAQGFLSQFTDLRYFAIGKPFAVPVPFIRWIAEGHWSTTGPGGKPLDLIGWVNIPMPFLILLAIAILAAVLLNRTIYGRYLLALGRNEQAARYSGIRTDRMIILAYVICSLLAGVGGMLFIFDISTGQPSGFGNFYELYAIAAAVLGGCSLRGGEGSILGVIVGAAVMQVLYTSIIMLRIPAQLEFAIIGAVILFGVIADELVKRVAARRRAARQGVL